MEHDAGVEGCRLGSPRLPLGSARDLPQNKELGKLACVYKPLSKDEAKVR